MSEPNPEGNPMTAFTEAWQALEQLQLHKQ